MRYFTSLLLLAAAVYAVDTGKISGRVYDNQTNRPVENVNVYIAKSTIGASSNENGEFKIINIPTGRYTLVLSHLSYQNQQVLVEIKKNTELNYTFELEPKPIELPEIGVADEADDEWADNMEIFREALLGTTWFADGCEILNPYYISFEESEDGVLFANCDVPIIIENRSLGYTITYILKHFEHQFETTKYSGLPYFEEMESEYEEDNENWKWSRLEAYMGSLRHFLRAISDYYDYSEKADAKLKINIDFEDETEEGYKFTYDDETFLKKHGFDVYINKLLSATYGRRYVSEPFYIASAVTESNRPNELLFTGGDRVEIVYFKEYHDLVYEPQVSFIQFHADSVYFDKRGRYHDEFMLEKNGYMFKQRLAEMLPFEYEPSDSLIFNTDFR